MGFGVKLCIAAVIVYFCAAVFGEVQYRVARYRDVTPAYNVVHEDARYLPPSLSAITSSFAQGETPTLRRLGILKITSSFLSSGSQQP